MSSTLALRYGAPLLVVVALAGGLALTRVAEPASAAETTEVGIGYLISGNTILARDALQRVLSREPKNFRALYGMGLVEFRDRNYERAEAHLKSALAVREDAEVLLSLGAVYQRAEAFDQAEAAYMAVRKLAPDHPKVAYNLGGVYAAQRQLDDARREYLAYLRLAPKAPERFKVMKRLRLIDARLEEKKKTKP